MTRERYISTTSKEADLTINLDWKHAFFRKFSQVYSDLISLLISNYLFMKPIVETSANKGVPITTCTAERMLKVCVIRNQ
ncbi:hypothetical protein Y032_0030g2163 [Ancylostoma ceylanicum]|uniref:Uncharacterized protein n=1 Tax=Ancylostoma ceylanicum TaxID=53326 RepID=A0A016US24_9BILA|nr:hypothetical protein Y032_0030g2163 [Ancylostoma ceylanicum]